MAAPDRIAIGKGLRRPWTMIAAEVLSWMQVLYFVFFSSVDGFCGWALFVACTLWFAGISLAIHNGRWKGASFFLFSEWFLLTFFLVLPKTGTRIEYYLLVAFCFLLPCVLLWLPPSIRWCVRRNLKGRKNEGARTDSHPENPEDGSKAPFTDNKVALYLSYVNGGRK